MMQRIGQLGAFGICIFLGACLCNVFAREDAPVAWNAIETEYAKANLNLAKARLAQAQSENSAVKGSVSESTLDELEAGVRLTQERLRQLESGGAGDFYAPQIAAAEEAIRGLESDVKASEQANSIEQGTVSIAELRRQQAEVEVAKARLAAIKALSQQPTEVRLKWEICQLQDQVRALWARPLIED